MIVTNNNGLLDLMEAKMAKQAGISNKKNKYNTVSTFSPNGELEKYVTVFNTTHSTIPIMPAYFAIFFVFSSIVITSMSLLYMIIHRAERR